MARAISVRVVTSALWTPCCISGSSFAYSLPVWRRRYSLTSTQGYFSLNIARYLTRSSSTVGVYQTNLPSFLEASISAASSPSGAVPGLEAGAAWPAGAVAAGCAAGAAGLDSAGLDSTGFGASAGLAGVDAEFEHASNTGSVASAAPPSRSRRRNARRVVSRDSRSVISQPPYHFGQFVLTEAS